MAFGGLLTGDPQPDCNETPTGGIHRVEEPSVDPDELARVRRGDEAALRRMIDRFSPLVYGVALRITGVEQDAEEVLQDVFVHLPETLEAFIGGSFTGWLKVVTAREAMMLVRAERRRRARSVAPPVVRTPLEERTLNRIMLERALGHLRPTYRAVFVLKEMEGMSHTEIAAALDISEALSQQRLYRARAALRELLSR